MIKYLKFKMEIDYWIREFSVGGHNYDIDEDEGKAFIRDCSFMIEDESVMLLFDRSKDKAWEERIWHQPKEYQGRTIMVWGM